MRNEHTIAVIIPVLNEEAAIGKVIGDIPAWVDDIIVVDNGSTDNTARVALRWLFTDRINPIRRPSWPSA